jgi:hypothetical protein
MGIENFACESCTKKEALNKKKKKSAKWKDRRKINKKADSRANSSPNWLIQWMFLFSWLSNFYICNELIFISLFFRVNLVENWI